MSVLTGGEAADLPEDELVAELLLLLPVLVHDQVSLFQGRVVLRGLHLVL